MNKGINVVQSRSSTAQYFFKSYFLSEGKCETHLSFLVLKIVFLDIQFASIMSRASFNTST